MRDGERGRHSKAGKDKQTHIIKLKKEGGLRKRQREGEEKDRNEV